MFHMSLWLILYVHVLYCEYISERIGTSGFVFHIAVKRDPGTHTYPVGVMTKLEFKIMAYVTVWHALYAPKILLWPKGNKSDLVTCIWKCYHAGTVAPVSFDAQKWYPLTLIHIFGVMTELDFEVRLLSSISINFLCFTCLCG